MMRLRLLLLLSVLLLLQGCYKDELDIAGLSDNPFDPGYVGPAVFTFDTTFVELVTGPPSFTRQVFQFKVNSELFLAPQAYDVFVQDPLAGSTSYVHQLPPGSDVFRYYRLEYEPGQEVCLQLSLSNNFHQARAETVCGTLP